MDVFFFALALVTALGCGLMAGLFFAFSTSVMKALARRPAAEGMAAMQAINSTILNPVFLSIFLGTAVGSLFVTISAVMRWHEPGALFLLAGAVAYLVGAFLVTVVRNVPMNEALARVEPGDDGAARMWADYLTRWTAWNHVRTLASIVATASLIGGLC